MKINRAMQVVFVAGACVYGVGVGSPALAAPALGTTAPSVLCGDDSDEDDDEEGSEETRLCGDDSDEDDDEEGSEETRLCGDDSDEDEDDKDDGGETSLL